MEELLQIDREVMGERLKLARKNKLLTQEAIAEHAGISLNFYGMIERGEKGLSIKTLAQICDILGESMDYIVSGKVVDSQENPIVKHYNELSPKQRKAAEDMMEAWVRSVKAAAEAEATVWVWGEAEVKRRTNLNVYDSCGVLN